jgi:signal transduction histidine kinase
MLMRSADRRLRQVAAQLWSTIVRDWTSYETPPGESGWNHLIAMNMQRILFAVTIQGALLLLVIGPLLGRRLTYMGVVYLLLASFTRLVRRRYGTRTAYRATYVAIMIALLPYEVFSGGVYSHVVIAIVLMTIAASVAFEIRTTLLLLAGHMLLLGVMSVFQHHDLWVERWITPPPLIMWVLLTLMTVNVMIPIVTTIQAYREALKHLENKVGALGRAEAETRTLLDAQSRFFWDISHELRSPLTRLNLSVGKVRREMGSQVEPSLERMENEVERLNKLIHQLLLLAQLKHGTQFPMDQQFDLAAVVAAVCDDAEFEANVAGRDLHFESDGPCRMQGCAELLHGALENVVRNAIRFAPEGTEIEVRLSKPDVGLARIVVADRGSGVPESQIAMLFDPFFRVVPDDQVPVQRTGSGLGLAIAFEAVKKHGGRISASNRPGGGLLVTMEIPGCADAAAPEVIAKAGAHE